MSLTSSSLLSSAFRGLPRGWTAGLDLYLRRRHGGDRPPGRLDVMTSFDGKGLDVAQVLLLSLSETHPRDQVHFWLFHPRPLPRQVAALSKFSATLANVTLHLVKVPDPDGFDQLRQLGGKPDSARFLWFDAHNHLPADVSRVIYLDALDTIVTDDLMPFLNHPFLGKYVVACRESPHAPPRLTGPAQRAHARGASANSLLRMSCGVLNSGAIVINLDKFRRDGIEIGHYLQTARWAHGIGLPFGDQGLFSLTHGSHYAQAHDRYNYRFFSYTDREVIQRPAVIHYAGKIRKPSGMRFSSAQEQAIERHLTRSGASALVLNDYQRVRPLYFPYYRQWWDICARTPVHQRIAPLADQRTAATLAQLGLEVPSSRAC